MDSVHKAVSWTRGHRACICGSGQRKCEQKLLTWLKR